MKTHNVGQISLKNSHLVSLYYYNKKSFAPVFVFVPSVKILK